jgi:para-aminobenzoate synthetase component 1
MISTFTVSHYKPESLLLLAEQFADFPGTCLLYSGGSFETSQQSYLALFPYETVIIREKQLTHIRESNIHHQLLDNPWDGLKAYFQNRHPLDYAFGFIGYEMGAFSDEDKQLPYRPSSLPDAYWQYYALVIIVDHVKTEATYICTQSPYSPFSDREKQAIKDLINPTNRHTGYLERVNQAQSYIRAGEIYQVNLAHPFVFERKTHPFKVFRQMIDLNPSPFSVYLINSHFTIVSSSPERFLQKTGDQLETRPIKGTISRGNTLEEDQRLKEHLLCSPKERAELLMITDLMRNDLGKICRTGTVKVKEMWRCEAYSNVFHLLSIIQGQVQSHLSQIDIIRSCFPGGSITGCPKLRAMEIIQKLEPQSRGIYTGSIGYLKGTGDFDLNIAIRTLVYQNQTIQLQLGSGIVFDSDGEKEYQETLSKGASLFKALSQLDQYK